MLIYKNIQIKILLKTGRKLQMLPIINSAETTTKRKIGKITYLVCSSPSDKATEPIERKIEKLILKDMKNNPIARIN
jgi:hypothetical protein